MIAAKAGTRFALWCELIRGNILLINALYMMLSTFVMAASGFVFWAIAAHTHPALLVGLATTLVSLSGLLSLAGLSGFDTAFVRFLAAAPCKNSFITRGIIVVAFATIALSLIAGVAIPILIPELGLLHNGWALAGFIFFTVTSGLNTLANSLFLAYRQAGYILGITIVMGLCRIILPLVINDGSAMTIFVVAGVAQTVGVMLSGIAMYQQFKYRPATIAYKSAPRPISRFLVSVYASSLCSLLPIALLPLIIISELGSQDTAYFYMAFTIASILYTVVYASMQSAFSEASHNGTGFSAPITKAAKLVAYLLLPACIVVALCGDTLLGAFGPAYPHSAGDLLRLFTLSALPVALYSALGAIFKVSKHLGGVIGMNVAFALVSIGSVLLLLPHFGLIAAGWSWLLGNLAACGIGLYFFFAFPHTQRAYDPAPALEYGMDEP